MTKKADAQSLSHDIETTRQQIGQTLDSIQARLTPQHLLNEARDSVVDMTRARVDQASQIAQATMQSAGSAITETLTENPLIGAIVGVGLSWFATSERSGGHPAMENQSHNPFDTTVQRVQDTAGQVAGQAQQLTTQVQQQAQQATGWLQHTLTDNPLLVGAVAVAAGLAIGMAIPGTPQENHLMGETRDNLVQKAQNVAQDTVQKVQAVAQDTVQAATQAATQAASQAAQAATQSAREQGLTS